MAWIWPDQSKSLRAISVPLNAVALDVLRLQRGQDPDWVFVYRGKPVARRGPEPGRN
jgi:hypothetical protein